VATVLVLDAEISRQLRNAQPRNDLAMMPMSARFAKLVHSGSLTSAIARERGEREIQSRVKSRASNSPSPRKIPHGCVAIDMGLEQGRGWKYGIARGSRLRRRQMLMGENESTAASRSEEALRKRETSSETPAQNTRTIGVQTGLVLGGYTHGGQDIAS